MACGVALSGYASEGNSNRSSAACLPAAKGSSLGARHTVHAMQVLVLAPSLRLLLRSRSLTREVLDACVAAGPVFKAHRIAHFLTQLTPALLCHTPRNSHGTLRQQHSSTAHKEREWPLNQSLQGWRINPKRAQDTANNPQQQQRDCLPLCGAG
jgi:hypothetical protein